MSTRKVRRRSAARWSLVAAGLASLALSAVPASAEQTPGIPPSSASEQGYYLDPSGAHAAFEPMVEGWFGAQRYPFYPLRALVENVGLLGIEVGVYWSDFSSSVVDWQFPDLGAKLTSNELFASTTTCSPPTTYFIRSRAPRIT